MRSALTTVAQRRAGRVRSSSISAVPPSQASNDYLPELAKTAASILYRSPQPSRDGRPVYILNAAAFPDAFEVDYDSLLSYVLARLPGEDELLSGTEYEIIFFAGGQPDSATQEKRQGPGMGWYLQAYHVLSRATRKKLQRLWIVHPRTWVRVLLGVFGTVVSPKFRRKIGHVNTLSQLAERGGVEIEKLLIPPAVYLHDRKLEPEITTPYSTGRRAFGARHPLPKNMNTGDTRLPRVLRETTTFLLMPTNITTEGLFRIPPHSVLSNVLREAYDRGQQYIIWKEKGATFTQPGVDQALLDEVRLEDAYGVHLAASLIKAWYRELRTPIFPESCYDLLRRKYSSPDAEVSPEDLVELIMPASPTSPLSTTAREILTRHLLPLSSAVAAREPQNKMNAENLAICFSMCLLCGADQMEDAKMSAIVKRIIAAAVSMWPQLSAGLEIGSESFQHDLMPPADGRDYEDPIPDEHMIDNDVGMEGHRIQLTDTDAEVGAISLETECAPTLPRRPQQSANTSIDTPNSPSSIPPRKPLLPAIDPSAAIDLPRYSTVFDADGHSIYTHPVADSPKSYSAPAGGFGPSRRSDWSFASNDERGSLLSGHAVAAAEPVLDVPKRKAVFTEQRTDQASGADITMAGKRSASDPTMLARMAAQRVAHRVAVPPSPVDGPTDQTVQSPETMSAGGQEGEEKTFRKPSWPASANRQPSSIQTLAKPLLPPRQPQTFPPINKTAGNGVRSLAAPPAMPQARAPSPGLLKRMASMDVDNHNNTDGSADLEGQRGKAEPRRLNLKKASVEDLRRLYEERVSLAGALVGVNEEKRRFSGIQ